jgi:hypothetical protein
MKTLSTAVMYGLVPVPPAQDRHAFGDNDDQPVMNDDANAALLAWHRHLANDDEIMRIRHALCDLDAKPTRTVAAMSSELPIIRAPEKAIAKSLISWAPTSRLECPKFRTAVQPAANSALIVPPYVLQGALIAFYIQIAFIGCLV